MLAVKVNPKFSFNMKGNYLKRFRNNVNFKFKKPSTEI